MNFQSHSSLTLSLSLSEHWIMAAWTAAAQQAANLARFSSPKSASTLQTANLVRRRGLAGGGGNWTL